MGNFNNKEDEMEVLFKKPRKYNLDLAKGSKIINAFTDSIGQDWITWLEFNTEESDSSDKTVTIKTLCVTDSSELSYAEKITLYEDDYNKLIGKK